MMSFPRRFDLQGWGGGGWALDINLQGNILEYTVLTCPCMYVCILFLCKFIRIRPGPPPAKIKTASRGTQSPQNMNQEGGGRGVSGKHLEGNVNPVFFTVQVPLGPWTIL